MIHLEHVLLRIINRFGMKNGLLLRYLSPVGPSLIKFPLVFLRLFGIDIQWFFLYKFFFGNSIESLKPIVGQT